MQIIATANRMFSNVFSFIKELVLTEPTKKYPNVTVMKGTILSGNNNIGEYTYIGLNCVITESTIGRFCSIANNVSIGIGEHEFQRVCTSSLFYKRAYQTLTQKDCIIGNDVWIGSNAVVRRGIKVGDGAVIGANSFVNKDVEPYSIVAGSPAKFIKMRFSNEQIEIVSNSAYWNNDFLNAKKAIEEIEKTGLFKTDD